MLVRRGGMHEGSRKSSILVAAEIMNGSGSLGRGKESNVSSLKSAAQVMNDQRQKHEIKRGRDRKDMGRPEVTKVQTCSSVGLKWALSEKKKEVEREKEEGIWGDRMESLKGRLKR